MSALPRVTVVMPIHNEALHVRASLGAVLAQDYPAERLEVLVVDGMSEDGTREIVRELIAERAGAELLDNPARIVASAMNAGLRKASGEVLVRIDGHVCVRSDYVRRCVEELSQSGVDNVGGPVESIGDGWFGRAVALAMSSRFGVGGVRFHTSQTGAEVDTVPFGAWRRELFDRIGPFDEELVRNQDDELNCRIRAHGGRILLCPSLRSTYTVRSTPSALWRQYFGYGLWKVRVLQKWPLQMSPRQFVPPVFVASLASALALAPTGPVGLAALLAVSGPYAAANLAVASWIAARTEWRLLPALCLAFAILHQAYGAGFLLGLIRFRDRWGDRRLRNPEPEPELALAAEHARIRAEYRWRDRRAQREDPAEASIVAARAREAEALLHRAHVFPQAGDACLELGCGRIGWLGQLQRWGVPAADLHGIELDPSRLAQAREAVPAADLRVGDAAALPWEAERFRLVVASTLFSSILSPALRAAVAREVERVLKPGGALLWFDLARDNPFNPQVRGISRDELRGLFPGLKGEVRRSTLAPPLARLLAPRSRRLTALATRIPWLRAHLLGVLLRR